MLINFEKYQGAGNDFIIINGSELKEDLSNNQIKLLCDRRFGIGADGLMIVLEHLDFDFEMKYYNADGKEGSMCGNGGRCIARYAFNNKIAKDTMQFLAIDGVHFVEIDKSVVHLSMNDVTEITEYKDGYFLDTGSPHFVKFVSNLNKINIYSEGKSLADDSRFSPNRTNVNFIEINAKNYQIATFERGVEDETLACGTGAIATAITIHTKYNKIKSPILLKAKGGDLSVSFTKLDNVFKNIKLSGPAELVYQGQIKI